MNDKIKKAATSKTINVKVNDQNPEPLDLLAKSIIEVSDGFDKINQSRLNRKAIVLLLQNAIGQGRITQQQINDVLNYAPKLKGIYTRSVK